MLYREGLEQELVNNVEDKEKGYEKIADSGFKEVSIDKNGEFDYFYLRAEKPLRLKLKNRFSVDISKINGIRIFHNKRMGLIGEDNRFLGFVNQWDLLEVSGRHDTRRALKRIGMEVGDENFSSEDTEKKKIDVVEMDLLRDKDFFQKQFQGLDNYLSKETKAFVLDFFQNQTLSEINDYVNRFGASLENLE